MLDLYWTFEKNTVIITFNSLLNNISKGGNKSDEIKKTTFNNNSSCHFY
jgi:hypothetical protein